MCVCCSELLICFNWWVEVCAALLAKQSQWLPHVILMILRHFFRGYQWHSLDSRSKSFGRGLKSSVEKIILE